MLGNGRLLEGESVNNLADGAFFKGEERQDVAAARFCDGVEGVRGGGSAWHGTNIYPYRNMSRTILAAGFGAGFGRCWRLCRGWKAASGLPVASRPPHSKAPAGRRSTNVI